MFEVEYSSARVLNNVKKTRKTRGGLISERERGGGGGGGERL